MCACLCVFCVYSLPHWPHTVCSPHLCFRVTHVGMTPSTCRALSRPLGRLPYNLVTCTSTVLLLFFTPLLFIFDLSQSNSCHNYKKKRIFPCHVPSRLLLLWPKDANESLPSWTEKWLTWKPLLFSHGPDRRCFSPVGSHSDGCAFLLCC